MPRLPPGTAPPGIAHSILGFCGAQGPGWGAHEMHHHGRDDGVRVWLGLGVARTANAGTTGAQVDIGKGFCVCVSAFLQEDSFFCQK